MPDPDFKIWKSYPRRFYLTHQGMFTRIITKNTFSNHRSEALQVAWDEEIMMQMESQEIVLRLKKYKQKSTFLVFYSAILRDVVVSKSQEEDISLLKNDFNMLIVKYQPMAEIIVSGITSPCNFIQIPHADAVQQLLTNLLAKKETILSSYDFQRLFRNYIWKIAENEAKNIIKAARRIKANDSFNDDRSGKMNITINASENNLLIHDAIETFHCKVLTYLDVRYKLLLCLKVLFDQAIFPSDMKLLFGDNGVFLINDFQITSSSLNELEKSDKGKHHRFELIRPFLNRADHSATDTNSYWRWTNNEVNRLIQFLNSRHSMEFNRETFGYLLDRYFQNSACNVQLSEESL
jgi:hypothetical protein